MGYSLGASGVCEVLSRFGPVAGLAVAIAGQAPEQVQASPHGVNLLAIQGALDTWPRTDHFVERVNALGGQVCSVVLPDLGHYVSEEAVRHPTCIGKLRTMGIQLNFAAAASQKGLLL